MTSDINTKKILKKIEILTNRKVDEVFAGNYKSSFKGLGLEVDELRKYEDGDDAKHIDWITTAKSGVPFVKKYKETRELTTIIIIDTSERMGFGSTEKNKKEKAIELMATILFSSLKNNDKFGVIIFGAGKIKFIPPQKGKTHLMRILKEVSAAFGESKNREDNNLKDALRTLMATVKRNAIVFLISDEIEGDSKKLLGVVSKKHDFVYLKVNDPIEQGKLPEGIFELGDKSQNNLVVNFNSPKVIEKFRKIRTDRNNIELQILKEKKVENLLILTSSNIYKELMLFFKKRQLRA